MLKRTLVLGLIVCLSQLAIAQKWFPVKGNTKSSTVLTIANSAEKVALISSEKGLLFQEFDTKGKNLISEYIGFKGFGKSISVFKDGFYLDDKVVFSIEGVDGTKYIPGIVIVDSENSSFNYIDFADNKYAQKGLKIAKFNDKIVVAFTTIYKRVIIFILNENLEVESRFEERITTARKFLRIRSLFTDDKENIYAGLECDDLKYALLGYNTESEEGKILTVTSNKKLSKASFSLLKNGNPVIDGLWSPKTKKEAHGFFSIVVDKETFEQTKENFKPFTNAIFAKNKISESAAAKGKGIKEVNVVKGVADNDGNFYRVFEIYYYSYTSNGNFRGYEENIFIVKYNELAEIEWQDVLLRKNIYNNGEYYMSYQPMVIDGEFIVFYNGHKLNVNVQDQKKCKNVIQGNFGYMVTYALKYDEAGKAKQEVFCENKAKTYMYCPKNFRKMSDNLLYVEQGSRPAVRGRYTGKFGIYDFEEED